ncbi:hypothetical protein EC913_1051 [Pseudomonas sp. LP_4_YM]|nr:hypothetical protein EC913_1051 [Pseudomonas sp. LP_4_YM]
MLTLENLLVLMVMATAGAWLWHNHGLREKALERVKLRISEHRDRPFRLIVTAHFANA